MASTVLWLQQLSVPTTDTPVTYPSWLVYGDASTGFVIKVDGVVVAQGDHPYAGLLDVLVRYPHYWQLVPVGEGYGIELLKRPGIPRLWLTGLEADVLYSLYQERIHGKRG